MPPPARPSPPPLRVDTRVVVRAGTALWALALVVVVATGADRVWWWSCLCGVALGGLGLAIMRWQRQ